MLDAIICTNFGMEKLRGLGNTRGQILESPIEMAGHPYNSAGATAQPVTRIAAGRINCNISASYKIKITRDDWRTKVTLFTYICQIFTSRMQFQFSTLRLPALRRGRLQVYNVGL